MSGVTAPRMVAGLLALALTSAGGRARAIECAKLPAPVFITGSTAAKPPLAEVAKIMAAQVPPVTLVYAGQGSCGGVDAIVNGTPVRGEGAGGLAYWDATGAELKCDVAMSGPGALVDIGISDVFASTCLKLPGGLPSNVADFLGPVQTMAFVVPKASGERSISAEAAYNVYGFGADSGVAPWTGEAVIFRRDELSGTQRMIAAAIGVDAARWKGTATSSSTDMKTRLLAAAGTPGAIGILSADIAQDYRYALDVLAYQHFGQSCGYYPDRDSTSNEKANVRDGRYALWGPLHLLTRLGGSGYPSNANAADAIGFLTGTKTPPAGLDLIVLEAQKHVVPPCAMRVQRTAELGPATPFAPPGACGCYYEKVANGQTACRPCKVSGDCTSAAPACNYGYCETQ
jgi:ABC-type phosphate transport system substrate-binding protein